MFRSKDFICYNFTIILLECVTVAVSSKKIHLHDKEIEYQLRRSRRSKNLRISIHPQKGLLVSCPPLYPQLLINRFIKSKSDWILNHLKNIVGDSANFKFSENAPITILGKNYRIMITKAQVLKPEVEFEEHNLLIKTPLGKLEPAKKFFDKWIKRFTEKHINQRVEYYAQQNELKYNRVVIKNQQTLWGSCSSKKNLNFSKRLIQLPEWLIDYVVCHELAHLTEMNHGKGFWDLVGQYFPDYKKARRHLKAFRPDVKLE